MNDILNELKALINKVLPSVNTDNVSLSSDLRTDLGIDSFQLILLSISLEEQFSISLDETFVPKSVEDVCTYIRAKTTDQAAG